MHKILILKHFKKIKNKKIYDNYIKKLEKMQFPFYTQII